MVSAKIMRDLKGAFEDLGSTSVDLNTYSGESLTVAFDVFAADTFIAGIADKIMDGLMINKDERAILDKPLIWDGISWITSNGQTVDIKDDALLFDLAQKIDRLRAMCLTVVNEESYK